MAFGLFDVGGMMRRWGSLRRVSPATDPRRPQSERPLRGDLFGATMRDGFPRDAQSATRPDSGDEPHEVPRGRSTHRRGWLMRRALVVADVAGLMLSFLIAEGVAAASVPPPRGHVPTSTELLLFIVTVPLWIVVAKLQGLYDHDEERTNHSTADELFGVFQLVTVGVWLFVVSAWLTGWVDVTSRKLLTFWFAAIILVPAARLGARAACRRTAAFVQNTVIVGAGEVGQLIARKLQHHPEYGLRLVGFVDRDPRERRLDMDGVPVLGSPSNIVEIAVRNDIERIIIAYTRESFEQQLAMVRELRSLDVQIDLVPRLFDVVGPRVGVHTVEGMPLLGLPPTRYPRSSLALKRAGDVLVSATALVLLSPLFAGWALPFDAIHRGPCSSDRRGSAEVDGSSRCSSSGRCGREPTSSRIAHMCAR